jgi:hypothetical protein
MNTNERPIADRTLMIELELMFAQSKEIPLNKVDEFLSQSKLKYTRNGERSVDGSETLVHLTPNNFDVHIIDINSEIFKSESMREAIRQHYDDFKQRIPSTDFRGYLYRQIQFVETVIKRKCPKEDKSTTISEINLWLVLNDYKKELNKFLEQQTVTNKSEVLDQIEIDYSELKSISKKLLLLHETGVIDHLRNKYSGLKNVNQIAKLISQMINENLTSVQPILNALISDDPSSSKYPKGIETVRLILDRLK